MIELEHTYDLEKIYNGKVPSNFVVPMTDKWPEEAWGMALGKLFEWEQYRDPDQNHRTYYVNKRTDVTVWSAPENDELVGGGFVVKISDIDAALAASPVKRTGANVRVRFGEGRLGLHFVSSGNRSFTVQIKDFPQGPHGESGAAERHNLTADPAHQIAPGMLLVIILNS